MRLPANHPSGSGPSEWHVHPRRDGDTRMARHLGLEKLLSDHLRQREHVAMATGELPERNRADVT